MTQPLHISSRNNPLLVQLRKQLREPAGYRRHAQAWLEGDHLVSAAVARGKALHTVVVAASAFGQALVRSLCGHAQRVVVVDDALFGSLSELPSPAAMGALVDVPADAHALTAVPTVVLDRVQDAGNVGSILRSAAAMGFAQVLALQGTAALWSPKVLRAGMGAHFAMNLVENLAVANLNGLELDLAATSSHGGQALHAAAMPHAIGLVLGHEGQGVAPELLQRCALKLRIEQPGGEESLNVAAAAAICCYAWSLRGKVAGLTIVPGG